LAAAGLAQRLEELLQQAVAIPYLAQLLLLAVAVVQVFITQAHPQAQQAAVLAVAVLVF
jgi:hypothetical protein